MIVNQGKSSRPTHFSEQLANDFDCSLKIRFQMFVAIRHLSQNTVSSAQSQTVISKEPITSETSSSFQTSINFTSCEMKTDCSQIKKVDDADDKSRN